VQTLVWTRGNIALDKLPEKMRYREYGNSKIQGLFEVPNQPQ
jgi:hypothetical protein